MLIPLASHKKWHRGSKLFAFSPEASSPSRPATPVEGGVLDLAARSGDIGVRFREFCNTNHVLESWEFILKVMAFKKVNAGRLISALYASQRGRTHVHTHNLCCSARMYSPCLPRQRVRHRQQLRKHCGSTGNKEAVDLRFVPIVLLCPRDQEPALLLGSLFMGLLAYDMYPI